MSAFRDLHPGLRPWAQWLYQEARHAGLSPRVTSTYRSLSEQQRLYDRYRRGESRYPAAPPGRSYHNYGLAFDMVTSDPEWIGGLWQAVGGRWGGTFGDPVHFDVG